MTLEAERTALLDALDRATIGSGEGLDAANRLSYRQPELGLNVIYGAGGNASFKVCSRNLGQHGMAILHTGFMHEHTECTVSLPTIWGTIEKVVADIVKCRHVAGMVHEIELTFRDPINLQMFVERGPALSKLLSQNLDPTKLKGRVLVLDDQQIENELFRHLLRGTKVEVETVTQMGEAMDKLKTHAYDLVLCDLNLGEEKGEEFILAIKSMGCASPIVALTGETDPARLKAAKDAGASAILEKPIEKQRLLTTLMEWLMETAGKGDSSTEPIHSTIIDSPGGSEIVRAYIDSIARTLTALRKAIDSGSASEVRRICLVMKESGGTAGFLQLSQAAHDAIVALDASSSITESIRPISIMRSIASRLSTSPKAR
jgi:CheY-like chemotaxis protein